MSEWDQLRDRDFWKSAWGLDKTQSIGQRVKEFCVTAMITSVILIFVIALLQGLFEDKYTWEEFCEESPSSCE